MTETNLLDKTKTVLKALIISSQQDLTVDQLNRDYRCSEGRDIPYSMLGHHNLKAFLHSIPDILRLNARTNFVTLTASEDSNSAHVRKLVAGQKPAKNRNGGRAYTNKSSNTNGFSNSNSYNNRQQQQQQTAIWNIVPTMYNQANSFGQVNYNTHQQPIHNNQNRNMPFIPKFEPGHLLDRPTTFTYGNSLLGMPPNKIPSTPFVNQSFNGQSRHSNKPNKETVRKKSTQNDVERIGSTKLNGHADIKENNHNDSNAEEIAALPDMNDDDPILFIGANSSNSKYGRSIPPAIFPNDKQAGDICQINVTEITSMRHFYFQLYNTRDLMSSLNEQLSSCYEDESDYKIERSDIRVGNVCASFVSDRWLRAEVLSPPDENDRLKLLFVDFGTIDYVPVKNIRYLLSESCEIRRLCHRGILDFVEPVVDYKIELKIIKKFCEMVSNRSLVAVISDVDENDFVFTTLVDTNSPDDDIIINKILMESVK